MQVQHTLYGTFASRIYTVKCVKWGIKWSVLKGIRTCIFGIEKNLLSHQKKTEHNIRKCKWYLHDKRLPLWYRSYNEHVSTTPTNYLHVTVRLPSALVSAVMYWKSNTTVGACLVCRGADCHAATAKTKSVSHTSPSVNCSASVTSEQLPRSSLTECGVDTETHY